MCFVYIVVQSQNNHIDFKGISVNGHIDKFVNELKKQGFTEDYRSNGDVVMKGEFTGKDALVFILSTKKTKTVWKVSVYVDEDASWERLKSDYYEYVKLYTTKYGAPSDHFEFFMKPYYEGDGYELQALEKEKCFYSSYFHIEKGTISVNITRTGNVSLTYEDGINAAIMKGEKQSSALDDI